VYTIIEEIKKEQIQMERRAEDIIRGRAHTPTRKEYAEREKRISAIINDRENRSYLSFLRGIAHNIKL
jgi:formate dehydrogenase maturation protein FdhE